MKALGIAIIAMAAIVERPATAQTVLIAAPASAVSEGKSLSRAEVRADLHMWQLAGMQEISPSEIRYADEKGYREAYARYLALIASPAYPALVEQLRANSNLTAIRR